jgi:hypothetical protein
MTAFGGAFILEHFMVELLILDNLTWELLVVQSIIIVEPLI